MAVSIIPRVERGRLYFLIADLLIPTFIPGAGGWSEAEAHQLDAVESIKLRVRHCPAFVAKDGAR